jgi:transposase
VVIHVRPITNEEGNRLRGIVRHGKDPIELKRAQVILSSAQGFTPPRISDIVLMTPEYVRELINRFNEEGFEMLKPQWKPGGNKKFTPEQKERLVSLATSRPKDLGLPFQQWSLSSLRNEAVKKGRDRRLDQLGVAPGDTRRVRGELSEHQDLEGEQGPRVRREEEAAHREADPEEEQPSHSSQRR